MQKWEIKQTIFIKMAIYKKSIEKSIIDLIFATSLLLKRFILYEIAEKFNYDSDFKPILS